MRAHTTTGLPNPPVEKRIQKRAADMDEYRRRMFEAADRVAVELDVIEDQRGLILSRTAGGRIYCRAEKLQRALREMDELLPPALPETEEDR